MEIDLPDRFRSPDPRYSLSTRFTWDLGGVPEWLNGAVSKTVVGLEVYRGFESLPLRCSDAWLPDGIRLLDKGSRGLACGATTFEYLPLRR